MNEIENRLTECFVVVFPDVSRQEISSLRASQHAAWDSLATVTLAQVIEEEFDVEVAPEEAARLVSYETAQQYVSDLVAQKDALE